METQQIKEKDECAAVELNDNIKALVKHLNLDLKEDGPMIEENGSEYSFGGNDYKVLTDDEADEQTKEYIKESAWAFKPSFLASHSKADENVFKCLSAQCESSNDSVLSLIDDFDHFVDDAIGCDGRGHFLSSYDGNEYEEDINNTTYYIYRTN